MEDKLVKYHHKAVYYYFKKIGICFSIFIGASVLVAIPVSVAATIRNQEAQDSKKEENKEDNKEKEVLKSYLTF